MERDSADPTCPHCGESVGARATYCMHCGRDIPDRASFDDPTEEADADGGETLLTRARSAATGVAAEESAAEEFDPREDDVTWDDNRTHGDAGGGPKWLRAVGGVDLSGRAAGRFLALVALGWAALAVGLDLSIAAAGGSAAVLSSVVVVAVVSRARSTFDGLRFGGVVATLAMVFVPFGMAAAVESGAGFSPVAVALVLVPVAVSTAVVAVFGHE